MKTSLPTQRLFNADDEPPVLIVVDMQLEFKASRDPQTQEAVATEIQGAIARQEAIIFLEYKDSKSATYRNLLALVEGYKFFTTREKANDGGADEVFEACMDEGYWPENFRVCGVNADGCIFKTVVGLRAKLRNSRIEVLRAACHTDSGYANWPNKFASIKNVAVV
ncbi:MAG: hypothetical protein WC714_29395 [Candidatus Obscuribacterales bacterium]|jgi:nicotinamidase-related amidase